MVTVLPQTRSRKSFQAVFRLLEFHTYLYSFSCTTSSGFLDVLLSFVFLIWFQNKVFYEEVSSNETFSCVPLLISSCTSFKEGAAINGVSNIQVLN